MGYSGFARFYDRLTQNALYEKRAEYFLDLIKRLGHEPGLLLDLACGTGSLTFEFFKRNIDVFGIDQSVDMLMQAKDKSNELDADILFLQQDMRKLDLFGTVDTVICGLDSLNHLGSIEDVVQTFKKVHLFLNTDGWLLFDLNTIYKHEKVLGNKTYVYDLPEVFCCWQNHSMQNHRVKIELDFFEKEDKHYLRSREHFFETAYPLDAISEALSDSGFIDIKLFDDLSFLAPSEESQRVVFAAKCEK